MPLAQTFIIVKILGTAQDMNLILQQPWTWPSRRQICLLDTQVLEIAHSFVSLSRIKLGVMLTLTREVKLADISYHGVQERKSFLG